MDFETEMKVKLLEEQYKKYSEERNKYIAILNGVFWELNFIREEYKKLTGKDLNTSGKD